ncbi:unnamed protein product [Protopolystoma xenopodis]|uniref:Uncharacterized protein n=1 Tax=Protopolystoma xenopodis TaxID=117903 RepID=A0A3S5BT35_9PLAT|nr:unnamed protein product [Protopolystoma xenopodis]
MQLCGWPRGNVELPTADSWTRGFRSAFSITGQAKSLAGGQQSFPASGGVADATSLHVLAPLGRHRPRRGELYNLSEEELCFEECLDNVRPWIWYILRRLADIVVGLISESCHSQHQARTRQRDKAEDYDNYYSKDASN